MGNMFRVNEIFFSIQGESSFAGYPCVFVRLAGCNLRCSYCDTRYAYYEGKEVSLEAIMEKVRSYDCRLVEITGGEPLLQKNTPLLIANLLEEGFQLLLETNGSMDVSAVDRRCHKIIDFKLPMSGEAERNYFKNLNLLSEADELKFVVGGRQDYIHAKGILKMVRKDLLKKIVINFSPLYPRMTPRRLAEWILEDRLQVRLNLQMQKFIWPPAMSGV